MNVDQIGAFLEHQGLSDEMIDEFFAHYGVKGQKWGVRRRAQKRAERRERFKSGKATRKDKLIVDLDFDRSSKERKADSRSISGEQKLVIAGAGIVSGLLLRKIVPSNTAFIAGAALGAVKARSILDKQGKTTPMSQIRSSHLYD